MTSLPIIERELRVRSRRAATHWGRVTFAAFASLLAVQILAAHSTGGDPRLGGQMAYTTVSWLAFLLALAAGFLTADGICRERREGTLGLMFLTDLKGHDVVLGKMAATGLDTFFALLGITPALALALLAGGVTGGEVARAALALLNTLLLALAAGVCVSAQARTQFQAIRWTAFGLAALTIMPVLLSAPMPPPVSYWLRNLSPISAFLHSQEAEYQASAGLYWLALLEVQIETWLLVAWASHLLMGNWHRADETGARRTLREAKRLAHAVKRVRRGPRFDLRTFAPIPFLVLRLPGQRALIWAGVAMCVIGSHLGVRPLLSGSPLAVIGGGVIRGFFMMLHAGGLALFAWVAARFFLEARRQGEIELLLCTPVGARSIITGQWHGLMRLLQTPLVILSLGSVPYAAALVAGAGQVGTHDLLGVVGGLLHITNGILDVLAVCWVGMWFGLRSTKPVAAVAWTVGLVELLPWLPASLLFAAILASARGPGSSDILVLWHLVFPILYLGKNLFFIAWARAKLRNALRTDAVLPLPQGLNQILRAATHAESRSRRWMPA